MCESLHKPMFIKGLQLTVFAVFVITAASAQNERVSFPSATVQAKQIVSEIEKQTKFGFIYNGNMFDPLESIKLSARETTVRNAMDDLIKGKDLEYFFRGNYIIINQDNSASVPLAIKISRNEDNYGQSAENNAGAGPGGVAKDQAKIMSEQVIRYDTIVKPGAVLPYPDPYSDYKSLESHMDYPERLPMVALKTNLLYTGVTFTPNLAVEFGIGNKSTIELSGSYNWIGRTKPASPDHKQRVHMIIRPEYRYWLCERFNGHYFGGNFTYFKYNVSGVKVPLMFDKDSRYEGNAYGVGFTYGYHWAFAKRWGADFNIGVGYMYMDHDEFSCAKCDIYGTPKTKHYFGPTRAGISLVFLIR